MIDELKNLSCRSECILGEANAIIFHSHFAFTFFYNNCYTVSLAKEKAFYVMMIGLEKIVRRSVAKRKEIAYFSWIQISTYLSTYLRAS